MKLSPPNYLLIKQAGSVKGHAKVINFSNLSVTISNGGEAIVSGAGAASNYLFSDANGVTFGTSVSTVTASVRTNYAGIAGAITGGSITVNTSGVSVNLPAYLTTAALSQDSSKYAGTNGAITGGSITVNTSGVSVNLPAYLTTAALSQDSSKYAGTAGAITGGSITVNTAGVSVNLPAYLTTAALSQDSSKYAGTNGAITGGSITVNTSGVSVNLPAYLTTAALSQDSSKYAGTAGAITGGSITVNTSGVSVNLPAYLTTAALSQDSSKYAGTAGAITGGSITVNTSGVSVNLPAYLTTAALSQDSSKYAGTAGAITGGSITVNTAGVSVNLPAYLTTAALSQDSSKYAGTAGAITGGSITVNTSGVSVNVPLGTLSMWPDILPGSTAVSTYYSGSTSQGAGGGSTRTGYTFSIYIVPLPLPQNLAFSELRIGVSNSRSAAGTGTVTHIFSAGIYSNNASTLSLVNGFYGGLFFSQNSVTAHTYSVWTCSTGGATAGGVGGFAGLAVSSVYSSQGNISVNSQLDGNPPVRFLRVDKGAGVTLTHGQYYFALAHFSMSKNSNVYPCVGVLQSNAISSQGLPDLGRENSTQFSAYLPAWGAISTTFISDSNAASFFPLPNAIAISDMSLSSTAWQRFHFPVMRNNS